MASVHWRFQDNGTRIAISAQATHGPTYLNLYETETGRELESCMEYAENKPAWAEKLLRALEDE